MFAQGLLILLAMGWACTQQNTQPRVLLGTCLVHSRHGGNTESVYAVMMHAWHRVQGQGVGT